MINNNKVILCILDGWGIADNSNNDNAIESANLPTMKLLKNEGSFTELRADGVFVGLPENEPGNSEVGHTTLGAGYPISQKLLTVNKLCSSNNLKNNDTFSQVKKSLYSKGKLHLAGLISNGGVHSHIDHFIKIAKEFAYDNIGITLHLISDGRDSDPGKFTIFLEEVEKLISSYDNISIGSLSGRFFAMDRDNNSDRIEKALSAILGKADRVSSCREAIKKNNQEGKTDEFFNPTTIGDYIGPKKEDIFLFTNFRKDRAVQIISALCNSEKFSQVCGMYNFIEHRKYCYLLEEKISKNSLCEILSKAGLRQARIAETEKYAHVTFFLSCGENKPFAGEERFLIPSKKVLSYKDCPQMSAKEIAYKTIDILPDFDFVAINFANPDMVGHTGDFNATIKAVEAVDESLGQIISVIKEKFKEITLIVTADHGNAEKMINEQNNNPLTSHTNNPVPFIIWNSKGDRFELRKDSVLSLADVAPTILRLFNLSPGLEMTGKSLIRDTI